MNPRTEKQKAADKRNLAKGEQKQFNRAATFGFRIGASVVFLGGLLGIYLASLI